MPPETRGIKRLRGFHLCGVFSLVGVYCDYNNPPLLYYVQAKSSNTSPAAAAPSVASHHSQHLLKRSDDFSSVQNHLNHKNPSQMAQQDPEKNDGIHTAVLPSATERQDQIHDVPNNPSLRGFGPESTPDYQNDLSMDRLDPKHVLDFCKGRPMAMFMDGFHLSLLRSNTDNSTTTSMNDCLNYLVASWTLSDSGKFKGAMVFSFLLALLTEALGAVRYTVLRRLWHPQHRYFRALLLTVIYAALALLGYLIMLIVMMYSLEIMLSVVLGVSVGNFLFVREYDEERGCRPVEEAAAPVSVPPPAPSTSAD